MPFQGAAPPCGGSFGDGYCNLAEFLCGDFGNGRHSCDGKVHGCIVAAYFIADITLNDCTCSVSHFDVKVTVSIHDIRLINSVVDGKVGMVRDRDGASASPVCSRAVLILVCVGIPF